eukprot:c28938_g3_i1 orf=232-405(-)
MYINTRVCTAEDIRDLPLTLKVVMYLVDNSPFALCAQISITRETIQMHTATLRCVLV